MKLYRWYSKALMRWGHGEIIVCAENIKDAKKKVKECMKKQLREIYDYYDEEDIQSKMDAIEEDLKQIPYTVKSGVYFVEGND